MYDTVLVRVLAPQLAPRPALIARQGRRREPLVHLGRLLRRRGWPQSAEFKEKFLVPGGRADEQQPTAGRGDEGVVRAAGHDHRGARATGEFGAAHPEMVNTSQHVGNLHPVMVGMRRVLGDDIVMEDERTKHVLNVSAADENLRPVRATEVDDLTLAGLDSRSVLAR